MKPLTKEQKSIRFWNKVIKPINNKNYCWLWAGSVSKSGYGNYYNTGTHRFAYQDLTGPIPKGYVIMHSCDNKLCVNPKHLSIGTFKDNSIDMKNKKRNAVFLGEDHGNAKLTEKDVLYIRSNYIKGNRWKPGNSEQLADRFGIHRSHIYAISNNKKWQWLEDKK
jgi:hypothetical protein